MYVKEKYMSTYKKSMSTCNRMHVNIHSKFQHACHKKVHANKCMSTYTRMDVNMHLKFQHVCQKKYMSIYK
jgi:hypothetical protein